MKHRLRITTLTAAMYCALYAVVCSCNNEQRRQENDTRVVAAEGIAPRTDTLKPAKVTNLDTCVPPKVVVVPDRSAMVAGSGKQASILAPPESKPAGFYVPMTTYAAEQGLYSTIKCMKIDRNGNIWFGTFGGGVCRYDGKRFSSFTATQGLANNIVYCIAEDKAGNLWFGTYGGGVSKFDGRSFTTLSTANGLANNVVLSIAEDKAGCLWFGTYGGGVSRYDPSLGPTVGAKAFTTYTTAQGLAKDVVLSIAEDKAGNLWFGTDHGISKFDPLVAQKKGANPFTNFTTENGLINNSVNSIVVGKNGMLWFGTYGGVSRFDQSLQGSGPGPFTNYTTAQGLASNRIYSIVEDKAGNLWFGTQGAGVSKYNPNAAKDSTTNAFTTYSTANGLVNNIVNCIAEDKTGGLWFGTEGGGVSQYHGKSLTTYTTVQGLANNIVLSITEDKMGRMWFGSDGNGVCRFDPQTEAKTTLSTAGAGSGTFTNYTTAQGLANNGVLSILEDRRGSVWFGTAGGGVSRLDRAGIAGAGRERFTTYGSLQGLAHDVVNRIMEDKAGNIWFGTGGGVSRYDGKFLTTYTTAQGLVHNSVWAVIEDKSGNVWFGTSGGVSKYCPSAGKGGQGTFTNYTTAQGLANNVVYSIAEDTTGNLWFGTDGGGVSRYDGKSFVTYTTADGLTNNVVFGIGKDNSGNLWFGTNEGFSVLTGYQVKTHTRNSGGGGNLPASNKLSNKDIGTNFSPVFEKYNFRNGYPIKDLNTNALFIDNRNIVWAGTGDKLVRFDRSSAHPDTEPPGVFINTVRINWEDICWYDLLAEGKKAKNLKLTAADSMAIINEEVNTFDEVLTASTRDTMYKKYSGIHFDSISRFYPVPVNLVLPYRDRNISFDFAAVEPGRSHSVNYRYKLEGYDENWSQVTNTGNATFGNIHEGNHTFRVMAQSADGTWSDPVSYTFTVLPPLYRTWWSYACYLVAIVCSLFALFSWRTASLRKEKDNLEKIVDERTAQVVEEKAKVVKLVLEQEQTIADRTKELAESNTKLAHANEKLVELIQYNSHNMREPLARVMGAISISEFVSNEEFFNDVMPQMNRAAHDLDNCIMEVIKVADETIELYK